MNRAIGWTCGLIVSLIGWFLIIYMIVQIYFWFNPAPDRFWFFNMIDKY